MKTVAFDTETYYDKECSVKTLGNWGYTRHPAFECYLISVFDGKESWAGHPSEFDSEKWLAGNTLLSHNAGFDINVYQCLREKGILPPVDIPAWHCTADLAAFVCGYRDLKNATKALFGVELSKVVRKKSEGRRYQDFLREGDWKEACEYAVGDVVWCWHIWDQFRHDMPPLEHRLSDETVASAIAGVRINWELRDAYEAKVANELQRIRNRLPWAESSPATSPIAIRAACAKIGIPEPPVRYKDEEAYQDWLDEHAKDAPWVVDISNYRKVNKMLVFLQSLKARRREDDRIDAQLLYYGAHTGRWAGALGDENKSGGINLQNLRKEPLELESGSEIHARHLFVPEEGHKFVIADYAQIEARVLNALAGNHGLLELLGKQGMSIYEAHARETMGWKGGVLKEEAPDVYALAKARVLMLGYGAGWLKFQSTAFKLLGLKLSEEEAYQIVADFREGNPNITDLWWKLGALIKDAATWQPPDNMVAVELPSGRSLFYYEVHEAIKTRMVTEAKLDPETKKLSVSRMQKVVNEIVARTGNRPSRAYGGLMTENLVQAVARDIFALGLLALIDRGWRVPIHVHDEVVVEVPLSVTPQEVVDVMLSARPDWAEGWPIDLEAKEAAHYMKKD